jgi:hypothetical protein
VTPRSWLALLLVVTLCSTATGCAALMAGGPDVIPVNTNPPGAQVYVDGRFAGVTPTVVKLSRHGHGLVQIYLPGFMPIELRRDKHLNGWFVLSALMVFFIIPPVVDLISGDWQRFDDTGIALGMTPLANTPPPSWYQPQPQPPPPQPLPPAPPQPLPPAPYVPPTPPP